MIPVPFIPREPLFLLFDRVTHASATGLPVGIITAFMQRGLNYSYEVSWGIEKCLWHMEEELCKLPQGDPIGFLPTSIDDENTSSCGPGVTRDTGGGSVS